MYLKVYITPQVIGQYEDMKHAMPMVKLVLTSLLVFYSVFYLGIDNRLSYKQIKMGMIGTLRICLLSKSYQGPLILI